MTTQSASAAIPSRDRPVGHAALHRVSAHHAIAHRAIERLPAEHRVAEHRVAAHRLQPHREVERWAASHRVSFAYRADHAMPYAHHAMWHGRITPYGHAAASRWHHGLVQSISCVPYARSVSGIDLKGNAWEWWDHAAGVYARGQVPELGSVLAFRSNPRMRLGHVAVVSRIVNRREVDIDQANWWGPGAHGGVSRNVPVVDVSEANDWSAVRVGLGHSGDYGSVYPTYGFIYDRPDTGVLLASAHAPAPEPTLNPAPTDLRPIVDRPWATYEQVAEAPAEPIDPAARRQQRIEGAAAAFGTVGAIDLK